MHLTSAPVVEPAITIFNDDDGLAYEFNTLGDYEDWFNHGDTTGFRTRPATAGEIASVTDGLPR